MGERKVGSSKCSHGITKASRIWRQIIGNAEVCQFRVEHVSIKGTRRSTIGNNLVWSWFARYYE
jgi:hypothetical protein